MAASLRREESTQHRRMIRGLLLDRATLASPADEGESDWQDIEGLPFSLTIEGAFSSGSIAVRVSNRLTKPTKEIDVGATLGPITAPGVLRETGHFRWLRVFIISQLNATATVGVWAEGEELV